MTINSSPSSTRKSTRLVLIAAVTALAVLAIAGAAWFFYLRPEPAYAFHGGFYEPPNPAPSLDGAVDQHGNPFKLEDYRGKLVFVYFGYTHCPDACPATLNEFLEVKDALGEDAEDVAFVMITVDPARDTPPQLAEFLASWDPAFYGVSMPETETEAVAGAWNVHYNHHHADPGDGYLVDHEVSSFVVDKDGNIRLIYPLGFDTGLMAEDAEYLLGE
ncbi:MAG TPA: SCO family protein [Thermomicrobiales bacterium]|nr:SCO family protein [Thermomicrobiales bacterium]